MKVKIKNKKKSKNSLKILAPDSINTKQILRNMDEIDLANLRGWKDLTIQMQRFMVEYSSNGLQEKKAAMKVGASRKLPDWKQNPVFVQVFNDLTDVHIEGIESVDYIASYYDGKSRGRFLKHRSKKYKDDQSNLPVPTRQPTHVGDNIMNIFTSEKVMEGGLAGQIEVFNKLKNQPAVKSKQQEDSQVMEVNQGSTD